MKTKTILRIIGSIISLPIIILCSIFIAGNTYFLTEIDFELGFARFGILICVLFANIFIWMTYNKNEG